jgi:hypothetical protein
MSILSSTVASNYYNCCTDSSTKPENYGYILIIILINLERQAATATSLKRHPFHSTSQRETTTILNRRRCATDRPTETDLAMHLDRHPTDSLEKRQTDEYNLTYEQTSNQLPSENALHLMNPIWALAHKSGL